MNQESRTSDTDPRVPRDSTTVDPDRAWSQRPTAELPQYQSNSLLDGNLNQAPFTILPPGVRPPTKLLTPATTPEQETKDILEEEANVLARWLDDHRKAPHPARVEIAVLREIARLRKLANWASGSTIHFSGLLSPEIEGGGR